MNKIDKITQIVGQKFRSFGGGQENPFNPLSMALKDQPFQFAAGVDIKSVVEIVLSEAESGTPAEDRYGHEPDCNPKPYENDCKCGALQKARQKVKPLVQYLSEYLATGIDRTHEAGMPVDFTKDGLKLILEQALDAYQSTENVTIKIERV